jgi:hypothetical protein
VTKWEKWYENQNPATQAWLDARAKEDNKFIISIGVPIFFIGMLFGFLFGLGM